MKEQLKKYAAKKFRRYPKTKEIVELREELYSMMCDKYDDCIAGGMSEKESYRNACELMQDCKSAVREVEMGSSLGALRKKLTDILAFSAVYLLTLTCAYLILSLFVFESFEKTWLITVAGAFVYLIYIACSLYNYARMFRFNKLTRIAFGGIFFSLLPMLYVLPSMITSILLDRSVWDWSWLSVLVLSLLYLAADMTFFAESKLCFRLEFAGLGLVTATLIYLTASMRWGIWNIAWIVFVIYLVIVAFAIYMAEKRASRLK